MDIQDFCNSIDIVDFFSQYTELTQRGREWWGLTPFREENTPSFSVDPERHLYYCFSTGYGGDIIDFVKRYYHCTYWEAVERLKKQYGVEGDFDNRHVALAATSICRKFKPRNKMMKQNTSKVLPESCLDKYMTDTNLEAWMKEGISKEVLDKYQVRYDPFANRLVYPIRNLNGEIVNIGGRTLDPNWKAKGLKKYNYYQSWGSINVVFGLYENASEIINRKSVFIFEGVKSVMLANTWGIGNCASILTSHLGPGQFNTLLAFCVKNMVSVIFALDKEINVRNDKHIMQLKKYINAYYLWDKDDLIPDPKMAPVDMGKEVFEKLLCEKIKL